MSDDVQEQLLSVFRSVFEIDDLQIADDMTADNIEQWDSLAHITLITEVEKSFEVRFRNAEVARLKNIGDLKALINKHLSKS
tara:strand:+ start:10053 stop:10298 length:246 start_codon:yes stop_codon:yes gene_type:complete